MPHPPLPALQAVGVLAQHLSGTVEYDAHNLYGLTMAQATAAALEKIKRQRAFVLARQAQRSSGQACAAPPSSRHQCSRPRPAAARAAGHAHATTMHALHAPSLLILPHAITNTLSVSHLSFPPGIPADAGRRTQALAPMPRTGRATTTPPGPTCSGRSRE